MDAAEPHNATPFLPPRRSLKSLREAAASCHGCDLWRGATQTVFGVGLKRAPLMLIGETPGDREDREGRPFVGPAGRELDKAFERLGIERFETYVTNAVKHFKFEERGRRRIHQRPTRAEIKACRPWLDAELQVVRPDGVALLGAVAAEALLGPKFRLTAERGRLLDTDIAPLVLATVHPASILRAPDSEARKAQRRAFIEDLRVLVEALHRRAGAI